VLQYAAVGCSVLQCIYLHSKQVYCRMYCNVVCSVCCSVCCSVFCSDRHLSDETAQNTYCIAVRVAVHVAVEMNGATCTASNTDVPGRSCKSMNT